MDLADIAVFVEAFQGGSLAAAARKLDITAMAASRRLMALEQELTVRLVHRTTRALALTAEGEAFLPYAQALLEDAANGRAAVFPSECGASGVLRVTASVPFGRKVVMTMMSAFMADNPHLRVELTLSDAVTDIVAQGLDLAIRIAPLADSSLIAKRLADSSRRLYVAPAYVAARGRPICLADLVHHDCLTATGTTHWSFHGDGRALRRHVSGRFSTNSVEALHQACLDGMGITVLAEWNVAEDVAAGRLLRLDLTDAIPEALGIWAVYPTARLVPLKVRLFVDALQAHLNRS